MIEFPKPLYETTMLETTKLCLVCGKNKAVSVLRNTETDVCPICQNCSCKWNIYSYNILKRINPLSLLVNIFVYKLFHPINPSVKTLCKDIKNFYVWVKHMQKFKHLMR